MRKRTASVLAGLLAIGIVAGGGMSASAHDLGYGWAASSKVEGSAVGGGKHWYGVHENLNGSNRGNDSSYFHASKKHRSSVKNSTGSIVRSSDQNGGIWARAWQPATASGNQAFWFTY
ncbi:lactococcin 972 family bacteriocin [Microbacterium sp. p3-SID336]|uniref:lactococcin 972 family bacteriocin n=1 Tax=Microbacterium sp. p3-SID336 TaxID=2916212 RepID=UPI0021A8B3FC|nr:lactococcin 972 family bacteriocin [Microbacterium sp. p3-SID336]MCT1478116.1 lactococcin 972 family bacteriocin [Microbacterium sp. p3-SID336]